MLGCHFVVVVFDGDTGYKIIEGGVFFGKDFFHNFLHILSVLKLMSIFLMSRSNALISLVVSTYDRLLCKMILTC